MAWCSWWLTLSLSVSQILSLAICLSIGFVLNRMDSTVKGLNWSPQTVQRAVFCIFQSVNMAVFKVAFFYMVKQCNLSFFNCEGGRFLDGYFFLCGITFLVAGKTSAFIYSIRFKCDFFLHKCKDFGFYTLKNFRSRNIDTKICVSLI